MRTDEQDNEEVEKKKPWRVFDIKIRNWLTFKLSIPRPPKWLFNICLSVISITLGSICTHYVEAYYADEDRPQSGIEECICPESGPDGDAEGTGPIEGPSEGATDTEAAGESESYEGGSGEGGRGSEEDTSEELSRTERVFRWGLSWTKEPSDE